MKKILLALILMSSFQMTEAKICTKCKTLLPISDFYVRKASPSGRSPECKDCNNAYKKERRLDKDYADRERERSKQWRQKNRIRHKDNGFRHSHNMSLAMRDELFNQQGNKCRVCGSTTPNGRWAVDHDHTCRSGRKSCEICYRGILCQGCNVALGAARDNPEVLRALASYIEESKKTMALREEIVMCRAVDIAWAENSANGVNGVLAVLFVIRNRADAGWKNGNWQKIIEDGNQFQATIRPFVDPFTNTQFQEVLNQVDSIYKGETKDKLTQGALYFCELSKVSPGSWFDREILQKPNEHPRVAQVGTSTFFR